LLFDVLSINSIVYLDGDVADLIYNEGNNRKSDQNNQIWLTTEKKTNDYITYDYYWCIVGDQDQHLVVLMEVFHDYALPKNRNYQLNSYRKVVNDSFL
jgi:hypothetical protein